jgi:hypothetical protein
MSIKRDRGKDGDNEHSNMHSEMVVFDQFLDGSLKEDLANVGDNCFSLSTILSIDFFLYNFQFSSGEAAASSSCMIAPIKYPFPVLLGERSSNNDPL